MKTTQCDICKRCEPEVNIDRKRRVNWWHAFHCYMDGDVWDKIDICDYCWESWKSYIQNRLAAKEVK